MRLFMMLAVFCAFWFSGIGRKDCYAAVKLATPQGFLANGVNAKVVLSWETVQGADGYEIYEKKEGDISWTRIKVTTKRKLVLKNRTRGQSYTYKVRAYKIKKRKMVYSSFSKQYTTTLAKQGTTTIRNLLKTALAPVGSTMYIWGGGWNKADNGAGADALRIGLNPQWRKFAAKQTASYQYRNYRYKWGYGLDCSGFVGWTIYNVMHTTKGSVGEGYVDKAKNLAANYADAGWGTFKKASAVKNYKAGDIMSGSGHVYIVLGECSDGSVVLVHSSPAGVQICGTSTPSGKSNSKAVRLARKYMKKYFPSWYKRYPNCSRGTSYLTDYSQFHWSIAKGNVMEDPDGYHKKSAAAVLKDLFE